MSHDVTVGYRRPVTSLQPCAVGLLTLKLSDDARKALDELQSKPSQAKILKAVVKTLTLMETNLRHPSLNTHEFQSVCGPHGEKVFEAYAQNNTPGAYRVFWYYGPGKGVITIHLIVQHP